MDYQLGPGPLQVDQNTIDEKIKGDIGIVENGDVATHAIPSGYYVIWKGDLYVAKTDISSGTTLSTSNLTAKPNGLGADVTTLNSNIGKVNSNGNMTNDVLASAESCTRTTFYNGNGGGYTGSLPSGAENSFRWSTFMVNVKDTIKTVIALSPENKMYTNVYDNGAWKGWETLARSSNIASFSGILSKATFTSIASNASVKIRNAGAMGCIVVLRYYGPNIDQLKAYPVYRQNKYAQAVYANMFNQSETSENKSLSFDSSGNLNFKNVHSNSVESLAVLFINVI